MNSRLKINKIPFTLLLKEVCEIHLLVDKILMEASDLLFLLSLIIYRIEKVLFSGRFFEIEFSLDLHVLRSPESKNHVFSAVGLCVCVSVCV